MRSLQPYVSQDTGGFFICVFERMRGAEAEEAKEAEKAKAADAKEEGAEEEEPAAAAEEAGGSAEAEAEAPAEAEAEVEAGQGGPKQAVHVLGPLHHGALRYLVITPSHLVSTPSCTTVRSTAVTRTTPVTWISPLSGALNRGKHTDRLSPGYHPCQARSTAASTTPSTG